MDASAAALRKGTSDFLDWWFGELSGLVPTALRTALRPAARTIAVAIDEDRISLTRKEGGSDESLGQFDIRTGDFGPTLQALDRLVSKFPTARWRWGLYLDHNTALHDRLYLPIAAKENFYEAVEFQINRQTPFQRGEVYFDCCTVPGTSTARTLCVDYVIAPIAKVDSALQRLASMGVPVDFVTTQSEAAADGPRFNLLPHRGKSHGRRGTRLNAVLTGLAMLLAATVVYLSLDNDRRHAAALAAQVDSLRNEARVASQLRSAYAAEQRSRNYVLKLKRENDSVIKILNDLTRLVPDDSWISRFTYKGGDIQIVIHAPESASIVRLVEGSEQFAGAKMMTAVRKRKNESRESFTLGFSVKPSAGR